MGVPKGNGYGRKYMYSLIEMFALLLSVGAATVVVGGAYVIPKVVSFVGYRVELFIWVNRKLLG